MNETRISLAVLFVVFFFATVFYLQDTDGDGIWRINFSPDNGPAFPSFINVHAGMDYSDERGYGWLDVDGAVETGRWPGDGSDSWESRHNLNLIRRRGPDDLARTFASGPATFAINLQPGRYIVWVLSGDSGHLEYIPNQAYRILVEGETAYQFEPDTELFPGNFAMPPDKDPLDNTAVWEQSIAPRFHWSRVIVDVSDGQLTVAVDSDVRQTDLSNYTGEYAHTEQRSAPMPAYTGALNAMVVLPYREDMATGEQLIRSINRRRQQNIREHWPLVTAATQQMKLTAADRLRGYTVSPVHAMNPVLPGNSYRHDLSGIQLRATPGEYAVITFAVSPLKDLGETQVSLSPLQPLSSGAEQRPVKQDLAIGVVRYRPTAVPRGSRRWQPRAAMIVPQHTQDIEQGVARQFWLTYHVPADLAAGLYRATLTIKPAQAEVTQFDVQLEVLPFSLQRPTHLAIGLTYFSPVHYALSGEAAFWARIRAEFADMRAHNMTSVQYTGLRMDDYDRIGSALSLYREAGFEQPIDLLESHGTMVRWRRQGIPWSSPEFQSEYVQLVQAFLQQARERNWPPVIINFGDEFTNSASEETGAEIARRLQAIPGIVTAADVNGYKEMTLLAPEVDIVAFNDGWDGPQGVNEGKRLLHGQTVDTILQAGAIPWLVNIGMDRFSNGFWFWKMVQRGVRGKMEWMYRGYSGMPYDAFDAEPLRAHAVYPGPDGSAVPSLDYEQMRMGLDDLAYLYTLERLLLTSRNDPARVDGVLAAEVFFSRLDDLIKDDMSYYRNRIKGSNNRWSPQQIDALRNEVIGLILALVSPDMPD